LTEEEFAGIKRVARVRWQPGDPDPDPGDIVAKAQQLQFYIDELQATVQQSRGQLLDPQHIEVLSETIAKLTYELQNLFK
jgi:hypothetical protein